MTSTVIFPGDGEAGYYYSINVIARDTYENFVKLDPALQFNITFSDSRFVWNIADYHNGSFSVIYNMTVSGTYSVEVATSNVNLTGSPYQFAILPGLCFMIRSTVI